MTMSWVIGPSYSLILRMQIVLISHSDDIKSLSKYVRHLIFAVVTGIGLFQGQVIPWTDYSPVISTFIVH